jgi:hypothetical protein
LQEFTQANRTVKVASQLVDNYNDTSKTYMKTTGMLAKPL